MPHRRHYEDEPYPLYGKATELSLPAFLCSC
jgi:hypothetical protein